MSEENKYQAALAKVRREKTNLLTDQSGETMNLVKGSAFGLLAGAGYGFFKKKNVYVCAVLGAVIGGVINGIVIPYASENI